MVLSLALDQYEFNQFDFGRNVTFRIYNEKASPFLDAQTAFDATGYTGVAKFYIMHGSDNNFIFVDTARAIGLLRGRVATIIDDIDVTFTDQANGVGTFAFDTSKRPNLSGYLEIQIQLTQSGETTSTEKVRVHINPSLAA